MRSKEKITYGKQYYQNNKQTIKERSQKRYEAKRDEILKQHSENHKKRSIESLLLERAQSRSRKNNWEFNITEEDIIVPKYCPILGYELHRNIGKSTGSYCSPSIDRIDPSKGYIKGNIQIISNKANSMKSNATKEELIKLAEWVLFNIMGFETAKYKKEKWNG